MKVLLNKRKKYKGSLPCPKCKTSLLHNCLKNAVRYIEGPIGRPEAIWNSDLYKCTGCGNLVLTDFGNRPQFTRTNSPERLPGRLLTLEALIEDEQKRGNLLFYSYQFDRRAAV